MLDATKQSDAIVRSLFPDAVADRLYEEARKKEEEKHLESKNRQLRNYMKTPTTSMGSNDETIEEVEPIAELFPNTTILFADFVGKYNCNDIQSKNFFIQIPTHLITFSGFTAWSSEREPVQVFVLLGRAIFCLL